MRADKFFAERFGSRTKAAIALKQGLVLRGEKVLSPDDEVKEGEHFQFIQPLRFVSQGGYKLERGLSVFGERVEGLVFADLGASTGGFCDCLLQHGAKRVYCVDVGENQLDEKLKTDPRVVVMDNTNARYLDQESFPEQIDGVVSDVSFISLRLILPAVKEFLCKNGNAFVLFKPQFECGGIGLGKSGILPVSKHAALLSSFYDFCLEIGLFPHGIVNAPLREKKNTEYVICLKNSVGIDKKTFLALSTQVHETKEN